MSIKNLFRFLWYDDKNDMLIVYRFLQVVFGITSSPFLLNATIIKHMKGYLDSFIGFIEKLLERSFMIHLVLFHQLLSLQNYYFKSYVLIRLNGMLNYRTKSKKKWLSYLRKLDVPAFCTRLLF